MRRYLASLGLLRASCRGARRSRTSRSTTGRGRARRGRCRGRSGTRCPAWRRAGRGGRQLGTPAVEAGQRPSRQAVTRPLGGDGPGSRAGPRGRRPTSRRRRTTPPRPAARGWRAGAEVLRRDRQLDVGAGRTDRRRAARAVGQPQPSAPALGAGQRAEGDAPGDAARGRARRRRLGPQGPPRGRGRRLTPSCDPSPGTNGGLRWNGTLLARASPPASGCGRHLLGHQRVARQRPRERARW